MHTPIRFEALSVALENHTLWGMTKALGCQHLLLSHSWWAFDWQDTDDTDGEPFRNCYQMGNAHSL